MYDVVVELPLGLGLGLLSFVANRILRGCKARSGTVYSSSRQSKFRAVSKGKSLSSIEL